ncbi:endo-beta-N-acetylglucosaminidase [Leyella stercorea]|uniref:endo-beta-N-acetylglucosaminidase n=1 Tax=Leyella stercorea TaxID=363265 RepID=UPI00266B4FF5|nr:T9SS type A sorting domain-containing protein [Leyella stercorea]
MKKKVLLSTLAMAAFMSAMPSVNAVAADDSKASAVYDFSGFNDVNLINLFYQVSQDGRKYPTEAEFAAAGIQQSDIAFIRSHVRNKGIIDRSGRLIKDTYEKRNLWMNIPMDVGKDGEVGHPNGRFASDVYSMWNYTNIFGSWNHGFFSAPAAWTDAAHKNGSDIYSGIKFFDTTGGRPDGAGSWIQYCTEKDANGNFKYVDAIINCLMYFGFDGINYNWEDAGYNKTDIVNFHRALWKKAAENGFDNYHSGIYTSQNSISSAMQAKWLLGDKEGRTHDLMLNYSSGDFSYQLSSSAKVAIDATGSTDGIYAGMWFVTMNRGWNRLNADDYSKRMNICLWGEHAQSRIWSYNVGADAYEQQANYQYLMERLMSGGNRNPLQRPAVSNTGNEWEVKEGKDKPLQNYAGLATWIPERSSVFGNLPFATNFNLGNGDRYAYKGKKTAGSWYNMATQDVVPTYRWLVVKPGTQTVSTDIDATFTHADQYIGGSSLLLTGKATAAGTDVVLYKTDLNVSAGTPFAKIAVKSGKEGTNASSLYVIVQKADDSWVEAPVGNVTGANWQEVKVALNGVSKSDVIKHIGLRVKGSDNAYKMYVGKLEINDDVKATPAAIKNLTVEVKEETKTSLTAKVFWGVDAKAQKRAAWDLVYNDEANIDHFEVLYKNGENGKVSEVGRTTTWATLVNDIQLGATDEPYIGVRSVSTDLKTYSSVEWVKVTRGDIASLPEYSKDLYDTSQLDKYADGVETAQKTRFVTDVTTAGATGNLNYHGGKAIADGTNYSHPAGHVLKVKQGEKVDLTIKCNVSDDGLRYCFVGGWLDFNCDNRFGPNDINVDKEQGERLFRFGEARHRGGYPEIETGKTYSFTVPTNAKPGKSRLRVVFSDLWFENAFLPAGYTSKGFTIDFDVEIYGDNPSRGFLPDIHDQGVADEPENLTGGVVDAINSASQGVSKVEAADGKFNFQNVEKAWVYDASGVLVKYLVNPTSFDAQQLASGVYLVKMQNGNIIRSQKLVK